MSYPVTLDILQVLGQVCERALKNLAVELRAHQRLHVDVVGIGLVGLRKDVVGRLLDRHHEGLDLVWVLRDEVLISCITLACMYTQTRQDGSRLPM